MYIGIDRRTQVAGEEGQEAGMVRGRQQRQVKAGVAGA